MQNRPVGEKLLSRTQCRVNVEGEGEGTVVVLTIGNYAVELTPNFALRIARTLWSAGKMAKRQSGDESKRFLILADLRRQDEDEFETFVSKDRKSIVMGGR